MQETATITVNLNKPDSVSRIAEYSHVMVVAGDSAFLLFFFQIEEDLYAPTGEVTGRTA